VYVESESKKVGNLRVPDGLMDAMRASPCIALRLSDEERVALLLEDYDYFVRDPELLIGRLQALRALRGGEVVNGWIDLVRAGQTPAMVLDLLAQHYDPTYAASTARNFSGFARALDCAPVDRSAKAMRAAARQIIESETALAFQNG
jgi:tRNA 2-selenouridine synthase